MADYVCDVGDTPRVTCVFKSSAGVAADPTTVSVKYRGPARAPVTKTYLTDAEVVKTGTGTYYIEIPITAPSGEWRVKFYGTGAVPAAGAATIGVRFEPLDEGN